MRITKKILWEHHFINSWDIARKLGNPFFLGYSGAGAYRCASWTVVGLEFKTDPNEASAWYDHGDKTFNVFNRAEKQMKLEKAVAWVKEKYGVEITDRDPHGNYHPKGTLERLAKILEEMK
jgi:hypothetical protein